jgi:OOP family OmpA-OmpF porin
MKESVLFLCLIMSVCVIKAQAVWEGGVFAGTAVYSGDVNPTLTPRFQDLTPSIGLIARTNLSSRLGFRGGITYLKLQGDDDNYVGRESRDFDFNTNLVEISVLGEWEPFGSNRYYTDAAGNVNMDKLISPYLVAGVGLLGGVLNTNFSNYSGTSEDIKAGIQKDRAYGNSLLGVSIPIGLGMKFDISEGFTFAIEGCIRGSFTDYLDGISFSGSPDAKDIYMNLGIVVYRRFGNPRRW